MTNLKDQIDRLQKHGVLRRVMEGTRDAGVITQILGYLDVVLNMFQASPSKPIDVPDYLFTADGYRAPYRGKCRKN